MLLTKALRLVTTILGVVLPAFCLQLGLAPSAKADFVYDITSTIDSLHVKFELPSFEQDVVNQTTFDVATISFGTVIAFGINGGTSGDCDDGISSAGPPPCWIAGGNGLPPLIRPVLHSPPPAHLPGATPPSRLQKSPASRSHQAGLCSRLRWQALGW
jgi:hypothetical protein